MNIKFNLWGMNCFATGSLDADGNFEADEINVSGQIDASLLAGSTCPLDELVETMDKAAAEVKRGQYDDKTMYFGEDY